MAELTTRVTFRGQDGNRLEGDAFGDASDHVVVLLHGGGQTRGAWGATAAELARFGWYAIALDQRGHGESEWPEDGDYRMDRYVADFHALRAQLGVTPALVGASLGGLVGLLAEGEALGSVRALVLVDISVRNDSEGGQKIAGFMRARPDGFESVEEAATAIAAYLPGRPAPRNLDGLARNLRLDADGRYRWHWDPRFLAGPPLGFSSPTEERLVAAARNMTTPLLLVRGSRSEIVSIESADALRRAAPHAQVLEIHGTGHMVAGDANAAFTQSVLAFLGTV